MLVVGALAVLAVAALVVVATPRQPSGPLAISATTSPMIRVLTAHREPTHAVTIARPTGRLISSFTASPHAIASGSLADVGGTAVAESAPAPDSLVLVRTDKVTYRVKWWQAPMLDAPEGTVVYDLEGRVVARVIGGELQTLVE